MIKKRLLLLMILPAILVIIGLGFAMSVDDEEPRFRVSVIVDSSSDGRWLSFRAGLEQAAEERNLNLSYVNTGRLVSPVEEKRLADNELADGSAGLIMEFCESRGVKEMVSELTQKSVLVLVQTDVEAEADADGRFSWIHADNEALGRSLGEAILGEYGGDLKGKTVGILAGNQGQFSQKKRLEGLLQVLEEEGAEVLWTSEYVQNMRERLDYRQENEPAEILAALDNTDLEIAIDHVLAAEEEKKEQVPELFGVGCSEKSVYYLDSGLIRGMIVPYDYDMGYQAATAVADRLNRKLEPMRNYEIGFAVIDRSNMYDEENERLLFPWRSNREKKGRRKRKKAGIEMRNRTSVLRVLLFAAALLVLAAGTGCGPGAPEENRKIKIGVSVYDQYDTFISELMNCFQEDAAGQKDHVSLTVVNAAKNQQTQNKQVEDMIRDGCDVICVNLVDRTAPSKIIDSAKKNNVPVIFFNRELVEEDLYRWDRLYYVGADAFESGILQGKAAAERCLNDPETDKNGDGSIQYIILEGEAGHQDAIVRSEYCVNTLLEEGVQLEKLGYALANWNRTQAQTKMSQMLSQYGSKIELVLANNDDMALGAIDAYKEAEIPQSRWPVIVGIDGTSTGLAAVRAGEMTATVYNDQRGQASAMFALAEALGSGKNLDTFDLIDGKYIRLPYEMITADNAEAYENRQ